jgi:hypothetical protein
LNFLRRIQNLFNFQKNSRKVGAEVLGYSKLQKLERGVITYYECLDNCWKLTMDQ